MRKAKDFRDQTEVELEATARDLSKEIFEARNRIRQEGQVAETHVIKEKRREIARIKTVLREKQTQPATQGAKS